MVAKFRRYFNRVLLSVGGLALASVVFAQKSELDLILTKKDSRPASGIVNIMGNDTTIIDNAFLSPKNYILSNLTGIDNPVFYDKIAVGPNPTYNGNITILFSSSQKIEGILHVYDVLGKKLGQIDLNKSNYYNFNANSNLIILEYINKNERQLMKIVNLGDRFSANIVQDHIAVSSDNKEIASSKGALSDDYSVSFSDPTLNIENYVQNIIVSPGNKFNINEILDWTSKEIKYSSLTNTNTTIKLTKVSDGSTLDQITVANGTFPTKSISNRFDNEAGIQVKYELTAPYTDPATFIVTQFQNQQQVLDTIRNGQFLLTVTGNGQTYTVKSNGVTIATKNIGEQTVFKKQGDAVSLDLIVSKTGFYTDTRSVNMNKGLFTQDVQLISETEQIYTHAVHGSAQSSIAGKTIKNGTSMYLVKAPADTIWTTTASGAFNFTWTDLNPTTSVKTGSRNVPGHIINERTLNADNDENVNITFTGVTYSFTQPIHVQNQFSEDIASANIAGADATATTGTNGRATISRANISTDANNVPFASYITNLTITKSDIQTLNTTAISVAGTNSEVLKSVMQEYLFWLYGNSTSPSGAAVAGIKDGSTVLNATVSGTNYETNHFRTTTKTLTINSIVFSATNYTSQTVNNITLNEGANQRNATLVPSTTNYSHQANGSATSSIAGKTIIDGTRMYMTYTPGDTTWTTTASGAFSFTWTSGTQNHTVKIGSRSVAGHTPREISIAVDDNTNTPISFTGLTYSFTQPVRVQNQFTEDVASANIAGGDATVTTSSTGRATVTRSNLPTNANNLPLANYTTNLTITKSNIQTLLTTTVSTTGANSEVLKNIVQEYLFWLYGNSTSPSGAAVAGIKDGTTIVNATVSGTNYETNHFRTTTKTLTLNSIVFSATNYTSQTFSNITLNEGANQREATLVPTTTNYSHRANGSATSSIAGKTIIDGTRIYMTYTPGDTTWATTASGAFSFSWTSTTQNHTVKIGSRSVAGHTPREISIAVDDNTNTPISFTGLTYSLTKPFQVKNQTSDNVSGVNITGADATRTTDSNGRATITKSNLATNVNNLPLANYVLSMTFTGNNIQTKTQDINATVGTNSESAISVTQEYLFWLYGNSTSPSGTNVAGIKDGSTTLSAIVNGTSYETNRIRTTTKTYLLNSIVFSATDYETNTLTNITLNEGANQRNATLTPIQQGTDIDLDIDPKDINGNDINNLTLDFKWADGTITHHSVSGDGLIHVNRTEYSNFTTVAEVTHVNDTATYSKWQIFRVPGHNLANLNYSQNATVGGKPGVSQLNVENAPALLYLYLPPTRVAVPADLVGIYGSTIRMDNTIVRDMMGSRGGNRTTKFMPRAGAENIYVFQMTYNQDTGSPIDQANLDRAKAELDKVLDIYTLNDGTRLLPYEFYTINSTTDPKWVEAQARASFDNVARTTFWNQNAYNSLSYTTTYSANGYSRIKNSVSEYNTGTGTGVVFTEMYQQFTNNNDPPEDSSVWVTTTTGQTTEFGKTMARLIYLFDQGTPTE